MLLKFRTKHKKIITWLIFLVIGPAFFLWSVIYYLETKKEENVFLKIANRSITYQDFQDYITMVQIALSLGLDELLTYAEAADKRLIQTEIVNKAVEYLLFLWKAEKEKINVADEEVIQVIKEKMFANKKIELQLYQKIIRYNFKIEPALFENHVKKILKIQKLLNNRIKINITDDQILEAYKLDNQKAKIAYIMISYDKLKNAITIDQKELEEFYKKNEIDFKEEAKVKIQYILIPKDYQLQEKIFSEISKNTDIKKLAQKFNLELKETDFFGPTDPILGLGWQEKINEVAFAIKKGKLSAPIQIDKGYVVLTKIDEKEETIPKLEDIKDKVESKFKDEKVKELAKITAEKLLEKIKTANIKDLQNFAIEEKLDYKVTNYFKIYDYIEGLGFDEKVNRIIFSLQKDQIYQEPLILDKGVYIVQLLEFTSIDEEDFKKNKEKYKELLTRREYLIEKMKFLLEIKKESSLTFLNPQQE